MRKSFGSDNHSGASQEVLQALTEANRGHALAYGDDEWSERLQATIRHTFGNKAVAYPVFNGTGANVLNIDAMCRSHHAVICADTAHINVDECGAPQRIVGCRLLTVATPDGKLTPTLVKQHLHGFGFEHHSQPRAISITQPTELGTLYTLEEIRDLAILAHEYDMYLHIDGARLANAAVALGCSLKEMTTDCDVDCFSLGGTKNGLLMGEAAVILNEKLNEGLKYRRKQMAQLCSKMRFIAVQLDTYLSTDLWQRNARHANAMAQRLMERVGEMQEVEVMYRVEANSLFVRLSEEVRETLREQYFFYDWDEAQGVVRWMCSFDTTEEDVDDFVHALQAAINKSQKKR